MGEVGIARLTDEGHLVAAVGLGILRYLWPVGVAFSLKEDDPVGRHLTLPSSTRFVMTTMTLHLSCQTMAQKSPKVQGSGAWVAM